MEVDANAHELEEGEIKEEDADENKLNGDLTSTNATDEKEEVDDEESDNGSVASNGKKIYFTQIIDFLDTTTDATDFKAKIECAKPLVTLQIPG